MAVVDWRVIRGALGRGVSAELILDHLNRESIPLLRALQIATNHVLTERYNVLRFGAKGDGATDDTIAIQNAFDTAASNGGGEVVFPLTGHPYLVSSTITMGSNTSVRRAFITQTTSEMPIFSASDLTNLLFENCTLTGTGGTASKSGNYAFYGTRCNKVRVVDCNFADFQYYPVRADGGSRYSIKSCHITNCAGGIYLRGVNKGIVFDNTIDTPNTPAASFGTVIFLDSTDGGHGYGVCKNVRIIGNHVEAWPNCQAVELHAGLRIAVKGNTFDGVLTGVSLNAFNGADAASFYDIDIEGNLYLGTSVVAGTNGNYGVSVQGDPVLGQIANVKIRGNLIRNANASFQFDGAGGIQVNYADDITVENNDVSGCYGAGIVLAANVTNARVINNTVRDTVSLGGRNVGLYITSTGCSGTASKNVFRNVTDGVRASAAAPQFSVERDNVFTTVTTPIANANNLIAQGLRYFDPATVGNFTLDVGNGLVSYVDITPTAGAAVCTNFTNAKDGQEVTVVARNGNITLDRGIFAEYDNQATWTGPGMMKLRYVGALGYWQEMARYPSAAEYKTKYPQAWVKPAADGAAGTPTAEFLICEINDAGTLSRLDIVSPSAVAGDNTNNAAFKFYLRDGAGGAAVQIGSTYTLDATHGLAAWTDATVASVAGSAVVAGYLLTAEILKNGTGVILPAGMAITPWVKAT